MKTNKFLLILLAFCSLTYSQNYWQQSVNYKMEVDIDVKTFKYSGRQDLLYTNNSPDSLKKVFYHLYFNAFQPGSEMSVRVKTGKDKNTRFDTDIDSLRPDEIGYLKVLNLKQDGVTLKNELSETILEVLLSDPLGPGESTRLTLDFEGQVPKLVRRAGRNSAEGVALSMAQWYPKIAEYDYEGWNAEPYLGREFHGVWGDFDVTLTIDKKYIVAASGYLQNPDNVGHGYSDSKGKAKKGKLKWHFVAPKVHDFTWSADPDYVHDTFKGPNDVMLHFFYKDNAQYNENWKNLQPKTAELMRFYNQTIGEYPYKQYTVAQGGDGGMEYAMLTLITGNRNFDSLVGVTAHELAHSWFQHVLATNEMKYEWMDEGFTTYISTLAEDEVLNKNNFFPLERSYNNYLYLALSGKEEPQQTNANRYEYNLAYELSAYSKGAVFLGQLGYVIGADKLAKTLKEYYRLHKFQHPLPNDFRRIAERVSGIQLKWYLTDWTQTIKTIDYGIKSVEGDETKTIIKIERIGSMPMPLEILVNFKDKPSEVHYIAIPLMRGEKQNPYKTKWTVHKDWPWAHTEYELIIDHPKSKIKDIFIDPSYYMADTNRDNNAYFNQP
ncbi:MAG: M1 family metallopeptidase [Bacteroidota bacterium]|nr:M1 family metallopeptidase [Bacteroidota bacterium]|tara:strand:+ start:2169 stop:3989 length:1821 start_codon:yes stop_codon:yes gene_type:complete